MMRPIAEELAMSQGRSFVLGPPVMSEEVDPREKGAKWSPAFAWSGQRSGQHSPRSPQMSPKSSMTDMVLHARSSSDPALQRMISIESLEAARSLSPSSVIHIDPPSPRTGPYSVSNTSKPDPPSPFGKAIHETPSPRTKHQLDDPLVPLLPPSLSSGPSTPRQSAVPISPPASPTSSRSTPTFRHQRGIRSMVSLDAVPGPPRPISIMSASTSYSPQSTPPGSPTYELPSPITRRANRPRFAQTPSPVRGFTSPSSPNLEEMETPQRAPIDAALRSAPGVIGLGEGWAGGPQGKRKRKWFRRRRTDGADADPLALWAIVEGNESVSPVKAMWNRSRQRLFGASTMTLTDVGGNRKAFFSRSRLNLSLPTLSKDGKDKKPRRQALIQLFTRSQGDLVSTNRSRGIPASPSVSSFFVSSRPRTYKGTSRETFARSEPHLIPVRTASLRNQPRKPVPGGPLPPLRSQLQRASVPSRSPHILKMDERQGSTSSTSLHTPVTDDGSAFVAQVSAPTLKMKRTTTFGSPDIAVEQRVREEDGVVGLDTLESWAEEVSLAPSATEPSLRKQSILLRVKTALANSSARLPDRSSTVSPKKLNIRRISRPGPVSAPPSYASQSSQDSNTVNKVEPDIRDASRPVRPIIQASQRRASWMGNLSTEAWVKRLSRLTEADEEESSENRRSFFERVLPARKSSLHSLHALEQRRRPPMPTSISMPALHDPRSSRLNLNLDLGESELGIDDILDNTRRRSIISSYSMETLPGVESSRVDTITAGPRGHVRGVSESFDKATQGETSHRRNQSVPTTPAPLLEEQISNSDTSTPIPVTPVLPSLFQTQYQLRSRPPLTTASTMSTFRTMASYHTAIDHFEFDRESFHSMAESVENLGAEEISVEQAVRTTPGERGTKASYISLTDLRASIV